VTRHQLKARLERLGLQTGVAAKALKVSRYTVMNWQSGRAAIFGLVEVALDGLECLRREGEGDGR